FVHLPAQFPYQVDVLPFVETAHVVGFAVPSVVVDKVDGTCMVDHVKPVPGKLAVSIDGQGFTVQDIVDAQGYQFLREVVRPVVVRAVRQHNRQTVGVLVCPHKVVGRCLG